MNENEIKITTEENSDFKEPEMTEVDTNSVIISELNRLTKAVLDEDPENDLDPMWHDDMRAAFPEIFDILAKYNLLDTEIVANGTYQMLGRFIKHLPLTAVDGFEEDPENWVKVTGLEDGTVTIYQNKRLSRLFADVYPDKPTRYRDVDASAFVDNWDSNVVYTGTHIGEEVMNAFPSTISEDKSFQLIYKASTNFVTCPYYPKTNRDICEITFDDYLKCCAMKIAAHYFLVEPEDVSLLIPSTELIGLTYAFNIYVTSLKRMFIFVFNTNAGIVEAIHFGYDPERHDYENLMKILISIRDSIGFSWGDIAGRKIYFTDFHRDNRLYSERLLLPITVDDDLKKTGKGLDLPSVYGENRIMIINQIAHKHQTENEEYVPYVTCDTFTYKSMYEAMKKINRDVAELITQALVNWFEYATEPDTFDELRYETEGPDAMPIDVPESPLNIAGMIDE